MKNWDHLLDQSEITINLLFTSMLNTILSEYAQLNDVFGFNRTPMYPRGKMTLVHDKSHKRGTWDPHGHKGW